MACLVKYATQCPRNSAVLSAEQITCCVTSFETGGRRLENCASALSAPGALIYVQEVPGSGHGTDYPDRSFRGVSRVTSGRCWPQNLQFSHNHAKIEVFTEFMLRILVFVDVALCSG
jgi:hypothetical protein